MGFWNALGSVFGAIQSNKNVDKQLAAQQRENQKNREYNLNLAKLQNEWNIQQWRNENAYNSPAAQIERMRQAGLNPDMMYGGGVSGNLSASSPTLTSGASSSPMDWSALGSKKTIGSAIMDSLAIAQARANVKKTEAEAKKEGINADILDQVGLETAELNREYIREGINKLKVEAEGIDYSNTEKEVKHAFVLAYREKIIDNMLKSLEASTKMTENALKEDIETLTLRIAGVNAENSRLVRMSEFTTSEWRLVFDVVKELLSFLK